MAQNDLFTIADAVLRFSRWAIAGAAILGAVHIGAHIWRDFGGAGL